ncbi:hypothetical protein ABT354_07015 [Streptomyces sp. NPDC000594]|uniref:hypothetical protein n=1 Tax=Streptomyces sp. NPDC000594 TaxID=3154261 RepID=UPI0033205B2C
MRDAHRNRLSDWRNSLKSMANPHVIHVILRRCQQIHIYTQKEGDVQHCTSGIDGVYGTLNAPWDNLELGSKMPLRAAN